MPFSGSSSWGRSEREHAQLADADLPLWLLAVASAPVAATEPMAHREVQDGRPVAAAVPVRFALAPQGSRI